MRFGVTVEYGGKLDPVKFFQQYNDNTILQEMYWKANLEDYLWGSENDERDRAVAFIYSELCEEAAGLGYLSFDGIDNKHADVDVPFRADDDMSDEEWDALVVASPWIAPTLLNTEKDPEWRPVDPGGTAEMDFEVEYGGVNDPRQPY